MTNNTLMEGPHIADGDILRFHDDECSQIERRRIARHLNECTKCAESTQFFEATTKQLNVSLTELDVPPIADAKERFLAASANVARPLPQSNPHSTPLLRAAIVVFALLGAGMWAPPVRFEGLTHPS